MGLDIDLGEKENLGSLTCTAEVEPFRKRRRVVTTPRRLGETTAASTANGRGGGGGAPTSKGKKTKKNSAPTSTTKKKKIVKPLQPKVAEREIVGCLTDNMSELQVMLRTLCASLPGHIRKCVFIVDDGETKAQKSYEAQLQLEGDIEDVTLPKCETKHLEESNKFLQQKNELGVAVGLPDLVPEEQEIQSDKNVMDVEPPAPSQMQMQVLDQVLDVSSGASFQAHPLQPDNNVTPSLPHFDAYDPVLDAFCPDENIIITEQDLEDIFKNNEDYILKVYDSNPWDQYIYMDDLIEPEPEPPTPAPTVLLKEEKDLELEELLNQFLDVPGPEEYIQLEAAEIDAAGTPKSQTFQCYKCPAEFPTFQDCSRHVDENECGGSSDSETLFGFLFSEEDDFFQ